MFRQIKWLYQRIKRGFDDRCTWSLDVPIAEFILPRLKRFKEIGTLDSLPCFFEFEKLPEEERWDKAEKKWIKILDDMIYSFECCANDEFDSPYTYDKDFGFKKSKDGKGYEIYGVHCDKKKQKIREQRIKRGLKYFAEYFRALWS
jgi:hypothetical protein